MHLLEVGQPYVLGKTYWPNNLEYNLYAPGHELRIFESPLSACEIAAFQCGRAEYALTVVQDIIFLLVRLEGFLSWSDAPYAWHMVPTELRVLPECLSGQQRYLLQQVLVDSRTGIIRGLRLSTLSPQFSQALYVAMSEQVANPINRTEYQARVDWAQSRYSSTDLLKLSVARCAAGS